MVNQGLQAHCPAGQGSDHAITETLGENLSAAMDDIADEASDRQVQFDPSARTRQIGDNPRIATMNTRGGRAAFGTPATSGLTMCRDDYHIGSVMH
ncbi:MAG: hypothetical protein BGP09_00440 [Rhizobium sp. 60-20]|nr:MAG: hypothetical protein BGP09_00440 [Rhizobium sp. 60-20]